MPKDHSERRTYRKSPGRQYGYEYDPLQSRSGQSQSGAGKSSQQGERWPSQGGSGSSRPGAALAQRPDPRRTRQLLRQNILASKVRPTNEIEGSIEQPAHERYEEQVDDRLYSRNARNEYVAQPRLPSTRELMPVSTEEEVWHGYEELGEELDYEEQHDRRPNYAEAAPEQAIQPLVRRATQVVPPRSRQFQPVQTDEEYYEDEDYEEEEEPVAQKRRPPRKRKLSRRGLLFGLGAAAVAGTGVAAYELAPKVPGVIGSVSNNIEHQVQDAFNRGMAQGAENVRREFVTALDNLEGLTLGGAINAAKLTREAYDVFVSPVVHFGSTLTGDFLDGMLRAFKTARGWLAGAFQDNATLQAIQKVLETWVDQVTNMPKQLDTITETDLDGAQAYLRALQRKLDEEKAKLNNPQATPTATARPSTPTATQKP